MSIVAIFVYAIIVRANSEKALFHCGILESIYLIFLVALLFYIALHVYFFIVILELYLEFKAAEPTPVLEDIETAAAKEEELQLLEAPKADNADETDQPTDGEKPKDEEAKEDAAKTSRIRCPELPKCPSIKCPSWGNCVGPDNFE